MATVKTVSYANDLMFSVLDKLDTLRCLRETEIKKMNVKQPDADILQNDVARELQQLADLADHGVLPRITDQGFAGDNGEPWFEVGGGADDET